MIDIITLRNLEREDKSKRSLPPRTEDVRAIANVLWVKPVKTHGFFCGMCDSNVHNEWIIRERGRFCYELRHLPDIGVLRDSELKILIEALEKGELTYHWVPFLPTTIKEKLPTLINKLTNFIQRYQKKFNMICRNIHVWNVLSSRKRWYLSKNRNLYNPIFEATIYSWNEGYNIARFGCHHEGFYSQEYAKKTAFKMWYKDRFNKDYLPKKHSIYLMQGAHNRLLLTRPKIIYSQVTIRYATNEDIPTLLPLTIKLGYPTTLQEFKQRFENFTKLDGYGVAVACMHNKIIGWVAWSKSSLFVADKTRFHIEGLVVHENYRRYGAGRKLMLFVEEYAKQFSPAIIDLTSGMRRASEGTHEFYKKLGYQNEESLAKLYLRKEV